MNRIMQDKPFLMMAVLGAALVGCGASEGGNGSLGEGAGEKPSSPSHVEFSIAEKIVAANAKADHDANLVARKFLNNGTEVVEFYEPVPGYILFSAAGSPFGHSVLNRAEIEGKTASELWALLAPGEPVPETLAHAIERSADPGLVNQGLEEVNAQPAQTPEFGAPAPAVESTGERVLSGGYCTGQFWSDWGNWGNGSTYRTSTEYTFAWNGISYFGVTATAGYIVCPLGDASNLGGQLTIAWPDNSTGVWSVGVDTYRWETWTAGVNCGWDISCGNVNLLRVGGTKCTPAGRNINGRYDSECSLLYGGTCGDHYDWISFASYRNAWCE
jgi:hypothetical protein